MLRVRPKYCKECSKEIETDIAEGWKRPICPSCARVDSMEAAILREWEHEQWGVDE